jgi:SNF2 family DNA or RNA helicase
LGEGDWAFTPGEGPSGLQRRADAGLKPVIRDLELEKDRALYWHHQCTPYLATGDDHAMGGVSHSIFDACEILEILHDAGEEIEIRWPHGEAIRIAGEGSLDRCAIKISAGENWLSVDGEISINETDVLSFRDLLQSSERHSRFVALGEGRFVKLQQALQEKARTLSSLGEWTESGLKVHPIAAHTLKDTLDEVGALKADKQWRALLARQTTIQSTEIDVPDTLHAELRDYQKTGFVWLARLAELGAGACLADDMGLGKTVQVLTLLLHRQSRGPALVVAPTSVAGNWVQESQRFAPDLRVHWIGPGQRDNPRVVWQPGDLVITSYTLFQQDVLGLSQSRWATVVLDEAQAIKNTGTKRSQSAMRIEADFKVITTGTPIENNLSELWNLFRFINPGLLGSLESFQTRFATPVERDGEESAREQLKRLISPFVLRRTKSEVLKELPERTEVSLSLELSAEEAALYEAQRREILREVEEEQGEDREPNRMRVLAGIMKLRRMCCHPRLVAPESTFGATKTATFLELVKELQEGGHQALVFSQFVDHLHILREALDKKGIRYSYLDGGTPLNERVRRVASFQAGDSDLFLISLRAGGTGLNLTAADYVIHMDPWWNPAVEDQASDRAHRMGQTRPVTVYRLIMANTIEEKIMALHDRKRHLADSLLDGVGEAAALSVNELVGLLKDA